jgi:hypothetical protein
MIMMMGILQELKKVKIKKIILEEMKTMFMRKKSSSKIKNIKIARIIKITLMIKKILTKIIIGII